MAPRHAAIVFDFDGVLVESVDVKTRAFAALYAEHGEAVVRAVTDYHLANGGISRYVKFRHYQENLLGRPYDDALGAELSARFSRLVVDAVVAAPAVAGAREFLERYHARVPLYVASGTPEEELREIVARRGLGGYFAGVYGTPATKGEILRRIAAARALDPARILMVGDALSDLAGAREAGTAFIGRRTAGGEAFPAGVTVIADLRELPALA